MANSAAGVAPEVNTGISRTPRVPLILGYAGTLPFFGSAFVAAFAGYPEDAATVTQLYGGSILSFLGGTHWGLALTHASAVKSVGLFGSPGRDFVLSVVPSLVGFGSMIAPPVAGLPVLATSFASMWLYDRLRLSVLTSVPSWYIALRTPLSIAATGACLVSWFAVRPDSDFKTHAQLAAAGAHVVDKVTPDQSDAAVETETPGTVVHATPEAVTEDIVEEVEAETKPQIDAGEAASAEERTT